MTYDCSRQLWKKQAIPLPKQAECGLKSYTVDKRTFWSTSQYAANQHKTSFHHTSPLHRHRRSSASVSGLSVSSFILRLTYLTLYWRGPRNNAYYYDDDNNNDDNVITAIILQHAEHCQRTIHPVDTENSVSAQRHTLHAQLHALQIITVRLSLHLICSEHDSDFYTEKCYEAGKSTTGCDKNSTMWFLRRPNDSVTRSTLLHIIVTRNGKK